MSKHLVVKTKSNPGISCIGGLISIIITIYNCLIIFASSEQYISDRLCQSIGVKVNQSITASQLSSQSGSTISYFESHHVALMNSSDGAKYSLWIQCTIIDSASGNATDKAGGRPRNALADPPSSSAGIDNIDTILDWTFGGASPNEEDSVLGEDKPTNRSPVIQDIRYDYLTSVAKRCKQRILRQCNYFKIGLINSREHSKCPACGSNDSNCENVHQCTSNCGQIKSINYPQNYGNNHRCRWSIRAPNGFYVNLSVIDFDIPSANNATKLGSCIFDFLTLIDGYTGKRIGCYCNENLPPSYIVSPWNELIIQFDTNSETTGRGFNFQYDFMKLELNEQITSQLYPATVQSLASSATINSGGSQIHPANNNQLLASNPMTSSGQQQQQQSSLASSGSSNLQNLCLSGWKYFRGSCYRAYNEIEPLQWYDAENKCNVFGEGLDGHLVSILDRDEMLVILYWLTNVWNSTRYREYYIGLIDVSREGLYRWSDNNPMSYTDWELKPMLLEDETPAQPDGGAYEDCTVIRYSSFSRTSNWHDVPCSLGKHYHSHLDKSDTQINFKWDYVSSYICKSDSISLATSLTRSKVRRPLFSNEFKPSPNTAHLISHLSGGGNISSGQQQVATNPPSSRPISGDKQPSLNESNVSNPMNSSSGPAISQNPASTVPLEPGINERGRNQRLESFAHLSKLDDNRYFVCDNLEVISTVLRCDGIAHCRDGSDESNGCGQDCLDWQYKCANGRCISIGYYCDFNDDCGDGSDESRCERHRCKLNEFRCQSGQCIPAHQRCDLLPDCRDSSDEGRSCTIGSNCNSASTFQCYNGLCIPQYAVCDFQIDCPGKFHEDEDASTCELLQRQSNLSSSGSLSNGLMSQLIPSVHNRQQHQLIVQQHQMQQQLQQQQQHQQQPQQGQEISKVVFYPANHLASIDTLPSNLFRCKSGNTIDISQRCLFEFDKYGYQIGCRDVSHLVDCHSFECPQRDYVKCSNSYCIPWRYVCDGKWDCIMGDDEVGCARYVCPGQYKCANQSSCILLHQLCDGHRQCPMGDDEWFCDLQCPIGCDCIGQSVNCRGANLTYLASNYISRSVRKLDLSYNRLGPNLSNSNFDSYHDLGELILNHNEIEVLTPRKFHQLRNLYKLDLSYNQIHSVKRGAFAGLRRVTQLLLESNQQLFLLEPEAFLGLSSLQILNISSSRIQSLRKNTFDGLTSLRHLLLRSNMVRIVEDGAFRSLSSLVSLDMRGNDIKHFTKSVFSDLKSLRNLSTDSFKFCCLMNHQIPSDKCLPLPDEISDCEDLLSSVPQRTCIWIAGGIACVGNLIVIIWRYRDRLGQKEREVEQINSTLLLSLACSDLLMGIYLIIIALVDSWYRGRYIENADKWRESPLCNLCGFLSTVSSSVSVMTLVFIAHNRFIEICRPFSMPNKFTLGYTHRLIQMSWITALIVATLPLLIWPYFQGKFYARSGVCLAFHITDHRAAGWLYSILVSPCFNLVAFLFIFKCYIRIYLEISKHTTRTRETFIQEQQQSSGLSNESMSANHHIKILLIVLVHFVAFSPPIIIVFISLAGYTPPAALYSWIAVLVLPVNSAINPMIYTIPNIRQTIKLLIKNYRARKSGSVGVLARQRYSNNPSTTSANNTNENSGSSPRALESNNQLAGHRLRSEVNGKLELGPMMRVGQSGSDSNGGLRRRLSRRNIPPGYAPLRYYISQSDKMSADQLVQIAWGIAKDIEQKHRDSKVYVSLNVDDIFVSDQIVAPGSLGDNNQRPRLAVFVADHEGYRHKKGQVCTHQRCISNEVNSITHGDESGSAALGLTTTNNSIHSPLNHYALGHLKHLHKPSANCECHDVTRFGEILSHLVKLYADRRSYKNNSTKSNNKLAIE